MPKALTADDLVPLLAQLDPAEQLRLAKLALRATAHGGAHDAARYAAAPPTDDELRTDDEPLSWDADGWEAVGRDLR